MTTLVLCLTVVHLRNFTNISKDDIYNVLSLFSRVPAGSDQPAPARRSAHLHGQRRQRVRHRGGRRALQASHSPHQVIPSGSVQGSILAIKTISKLIAVEYGGVIKYLVANFETAD